MTNKNELEVVNFTNILDVPFVGMWGGEEYHFSKGETRPLVRFMAEHFAKHLVDQLLNAGGKDYSDETLRKGHLEKIIGEVALMKGKTASGTKPKTEEFAEVANLNSHLPAGEMVVGDGAKEDGNKGTKTV